MKTEINLKKQVKSVQSRRKKFLFFSISGFLVLGGVAAAIPLTLGSQLINSNSLITGSRPGDAPSGNQNGPNFIVRVKNADTLPPLFPYVTSTTRDTQTAAQQAEVIKRLMNLSDESKLNLLTNWLVGSGLTIENVKNIKITVTANADGSVDVNLSQVEGVTNLIADTKITLLNLRTIEVKTAPQFGPASLNTNATIVRTDFTNFITLRETNPKSALALKVLQNNYTGINETNFKLFNLEFLTTQNQAMQNIRLQFNADTSANPSYFFKAKIVVPKEFTERGFVVGTQAFLISDLMTFIP